MNFDCNGPNAAGHSFANNFFHGFIHHSLRAEFQKLQDRIILENHPKKLSDPSPLALKIAIVEMASKIITIFCNTNSNTSNNNLMRIK